MTLKSKLKNILTVGLISASYLATAAGGWAMHDILSSRAEIVKLSDFAAEKRKKKSSELEAILDSTQKLINISTYEFAYYDRLGNKTTEEKELYFIGSAVGIYKNLEEKILLFLSCDHITDSPERIISFTATEKQGKTFYQGNIKHNGFDKPYLCTEPIKRPGFKVGIGKLKNKRLGLFKSADYDKDGRATKVYVDSATELADTGKQESKKDFVYNDDITLLKIDEKVVHKYNVWKGSWAKDVKPGDKIYAVGYPLNLSKQITQGIISSKGNPHQDFDDNFYFTSAQLNPGNSGGGIWKIIKKDGKEKMEFLGLGRLKFYADGISGIVKLDKIKDFLRKNGYSYVYKK